MEEENGEEKERETGKGWDNCPSDVLASWDRVRNSDIKLTKRRTNLAE